MPRAGVGAGDVSGMRGRRAGWQKGLRRYPGGGAAGQMQGWGGGGWSPLGAKAQGAGPWAVAALR